MQTWSELFWPHRDLDRHRTSSWIQIEIGVLQDNDDDGDKYEDDDKAHLSEVTSPTSFHRLKSVLNSAGSPPSITLIMILMMMMDWIGQN